MAGRSKVHEVHEDIASQACRRESKPEHVKRACGKFSFAVCFPDVVTPTPFRTPRRPARLAGGGSARGEGRRRDDRGGFHRDVRAAPWPLGGLRGPDRGGPPATGPGHRCARSPRGGSCAFRWPGGARSAASRVRLAWGHAADRGTGCPCDRSCGSMHRGWTLFLAALFGESGGMGWPLGDACGDTSRWGDPSPGPSRKERGEDWGACGMGASLDPGGLACVGMGAGSCSAISVGFFGLGCGCRVAWASRLGRRAAFSKRRFR